MGHVGAGALSVLAGIVTALGVIYLWVSGFGSLDADAALNWTLIVGIFSVPFVAPALAIGILVLEAIAALAKWRRALTLLAGGIVIPAGLFLFCAAPYLMIGVNHINTWQTLPVLLIMSAALAVPGVIACGLYTLLTWGRSPNLKWPKTYG